MGVREAFRLGTRGGAAVLGRDDIGSLAPGKREDIAVWRTDVLELRARADSVAGLVLSGPHGVDRLYVGGVPVVRGGHLVRAGEARSPAAAASGRAVLTSPATSAQLVADPTGADEPAKPRLR